MIGCLPNVEFWIVVIVTMGSFPDIDWIARDEFFGVLRVERRGEYTQDSAIALACAVKFASLHLSNYPVTIHRATIRILTTWHQKE